MDKLDYLAFNNPIGSARAYLDRRMNQETDISAEFHRYRWGTVIPFGLLHLGALSAFFLQFRWSFFWLALTLYLVRMFAVTAGYHRYFSHRTYQLGRGWQFLLAFVAETSGQKGVLWWSAHHRVHHQHADHEPDIHPPGLRGFWWAHVGWILSNRFDDYDPKLIADFGKYPELRWLDRHYAIPPLCLGLAILLIGGLSVFVWGFLISTVALFHATFLINSMAHVWGTRRFATPDDSKNNFLLAVITLGEGWHNNHHQFKYACRQGIRWWEVDPTYYALRAMSWLGIVRNLRELRLTDTREAQPA